MNSDIYKLRVILTEYLNIKDPQHCLTFTGINEATDWYLKLTTEEQESLTNFITLEISSLNNNEIKKLSLLGKQLEKTSFKQVTKIINELSN